MEDYSSKEEQTLNPCYYLKLAARGILKCLGLDSSTLHQGHQKRKETSSQDDPPDSIQEQEMMNSSTVSSTPLVLNSVSGVRPRSAAPKRPPVGHAAKGVLKCLGLDSSTPQVEASSISQDVSTPTEEQGAQRRTVSPQVLSAVAGVRAAAPPRPPVGIGRPPIRN
ncbi:hypothetical protein FRX31_027741 [Thalictrum thalictroides]|uniref:Uncharacterized protein n=1 Tax=Thalictrum thalictroides TaxID=46969 RepID=A0A7J6VEC2_THATH|nr:hypothetical protein FRX31_027741 [Thalictrum thalictroides]